MEPQLLHEVGKSLSDYIQQIIKEGSDKELDILPELVKSLAELNKLS